MERSTVVKILGALVAAAGLVAAGALLPKPPTDPGIPTDSTNPVRGQATLAQSDSVPGQASDSVLGQASDSVRGQATLAQPDAVRGQATLAPSASLHVYICGAVRKPGVYTFPSGARVVDAIAQAGGAAGNSDLEQLNLAQPLVDAMKVDVPVRGQLIVASSGAADTSEPGVTSGSKSGHSSRHRSSRSGSHKLSAGQTLDINTASESELVQLPGVGPSLARRIVEYRTANGPFQMPDDLQNVSGIGASKFAKMEPFIRI